MPEPCALHEAATTTLRSDPPGGTHALGAVELMSDCSGPSLSDLMPLRNETGLSSWEQRAATSAVTKPSVRHGG